jgi:hypothetical protein
MPLFTKEKVASSSPFLSNEPGTRPEHIYCAGVVCVETGWGKWTCLSSFFEAIEKYACILHRYLMSRLSFQVFCLWRHVWSTQRRPFILWWSNLEILFAPPPPQLSLHRRAALSSNSNVTRSVYSRKNPKSSLYCEVSMVYCSSSLNYSYQLLCGESSFCERDHVSKCYFIFSISFRLLVQK